MTLFASGNASVSAIAAQFVPALEIGLYRRSMLQQQFESVRPLRALLLVRPPVVAFGEVVVRPALATFAARGGYRDRLLGKKPMPKTPVASSFPSRIVTQVRSNFALAIIPSLGSSRCFLPREVKDLRN